MLHQFFQVVYKVLYMKPETGNWLKIANNDLKAADALFKENLYLNSVEHCHAALEKLLKGIITEHQDTHPPKIHNLIKLVSLTVLRNIEDDVKELFTELDTSYISIRYPDDIERFDLKYSKEKTEKVLRRVKDIYKWLKKQIN